MQHRLRIVLLIMLPLILTAAGCSSPVRPDGVTRNGDIVAGTGTIRFYDIEGGFFAVHGDDGVTYDPLNLGDDFKQDRLRVYFRARLRNDLGGVHMAGPIVELLEISRR